MPDIEHENLYIYAPIRSKTTYTATEKLIDFFSVISKKSFDASENAYNRILYKKEREKKIAQKLEEIELNGYDNHIFIASQNNKGIITQAVLEKYSSKAFLSEDSRTTFLDYCKCRLGYLSYLGMLNDASKSQKFSTEHVKIMQGDTLHEMDVKHKINYKYEVNRTFYRYILKFRKTHKDKLEESFEFSKFDSYIYNLIKDKQGILNFNNIEKEQLQSVEKECEKLNQQIKLMIEMGYLIKESKGTTFTQDFEDKYKEEQIVLNKTEKRVCEFIERHKLFNIDKYRIDREIQAKSYKEILKNRIDKLAVLGLIEVNNTGDVSIYKCKFTREGEQKLKHFYSSTFKISGYDISILSQQQDNVIDSEELLNKLLFRYGDEEALKTHKRQLQSIFIMQCAELLEQTEDNKYQLTEKGQQILSEELEKQLSTKKKNIDTTFKYTEQHAILLQFIKAIGGKININDEINRITNSVDLKSDTYEFKALNMIMRNHEMLMGKKSTKVEAENKGNHTKIKQKDTIELRIEESVRLGYIIKNIDDTLSLTVKGKRLINAVNSYEEDRKSAAYRNKKVRLLYDIDNSGNKLDTSKYLKIQRVIKDKETRDILKSLRYSTEAAIIKGLLKEVEEGVYEPTDKYNELNKVYEEEKIAIERANFKLSNVHKFILKFCKNYQFDLVEYQKYYSKNHSPEEIKRELRWKLSSCDKLVRMGIFNKVDDNTYQLTDIGKQQLNEILKAQDKPRMRKEKAFTLGKNYIKMLENIKTEGVLDYSLVINEVEQLPSFRRERELKIKSGMIKKLVLNGYIIAVDNDFDIKHLDTYKRFDLTEQALEQLEFINNKEINLESEIEPTIESDSIKNNHLNITTSKDIEVEKVIKITKFDIDNIINQADGGFISDEKIESNARANSLKKRIETLEKAELIESTNNGWLLTEKILERAEIRNKINLDHNKSHSIRRSLDCLTVEQKQTISDMKDFLNLSGAQIIKYIYKGNRSLFKGDITYLINKGIIQKDKINDVYYFTRQGTKFASELTGDPKVFKSKILSRREEVRHDLLVYNAYQETKRKLEEEGKRIVLINTDRTMRSEAMISSSQMQGEYSDLYVEFEDEKTGEKGFVNIEADVGYSDAEINKKLLIKNLLWFTNSEKQRDKVLKKARYLYVKIIDDSYLQFKR